MKAGRLPWLTIAVLALTSAVTAAQFVWPQVLPALRRQPSMLEGEIWRFITAWLVHDEGARQIVFNLVALAVAGTFVELVLGRFIWIAAYVAGGLAGEIAGIFWQPIGAGNSVAVCGLIGVLASWQLRRNGVPLAARLIFPLAAFGGGLVLIANHDIHGPPLLVGGVIGFLGRAPDA